VATQDGRSIAALLVLRYNRPVNTTYGHGGGVSGLATHVHVVFESMLDAMRDGYAGTTSEGTC
jgi:hypothetical protein